MIIHELQKKNVVNISSDNLCMLKMLPEYFLLRPPK